MAKTISFGADDGDFLKLLEAYIQSGNLNFLIGSGASVPAIKLAGNIEHEIDALLQDKKEVEADLKALDFIEEIIDINRDVISEIYSDDIAQTLQGYSDFLSSLDNLLFSRKNSLLPRQANIFTTNYDFFIERAATELSTVVLNDGFDRTSSSKRGYPFSPEKYFDRIFRSGRVYEHHAELPSLNLLKLHGSLTWSKSEANGVRYNLGEFAPLSATDRTDVEKVRDWLSKRAVVLPNMRKFESTVMDRVYFDLLRIYSNALDKENALLIAFGFSFADSHILDVTKRALRNPTAQLIIFAYDEGAANGFGSLFSEQRNVLIVRPANGANISFGELNKMLSDVTPTLPGT